MRSTYIAALLLSIGLLAAVQVITSANAVHAVFFLVLAFIVTSLVRLVLSREFRALVFLRVYVGAIAVLFLFVVRRLNVQPEPITDKSGVLKSSQGPRLVLLSCLFLTVVTLFGADMNVPHAAGNGTFSGIDSGGVSNITLTRVSSRAAIGQVLYTTYCVEFLRAGIVLLVARVGAIVLTLSKDSREQSTNSRSWGGAHPYPRGSAKLQGVHQQHSRDSDRAVFRIS